MSATMMTAVVALRVSWGCGWKWTGSANGVTAELFTEDPDLWLWAEPLSTDKIEGVALIDDRRQVHATAFRPTIPNRYGGLAGGDVREASPEDGAP